MNLMIDIETTGTRAGCCVLSIGAVPFNERVVHEQSFYQTISLDSCNSAGLVSDPDTMGWWMEQGKAVREEAFSGTVALSEVLINFTHYLWQLPKIEAYWCKGASFDFPILEAAYRAEGTSSPVPYGKQRCYRTLSKLFPYVVPSINNLAAHNALADAKYQAEHAISLLNWGARCQHS